MLRIGNVSAALGLLLLPSVVFAQATIAGVVRDASAAVLPGVTVEEKDCARICWNGIEDLAQQLALKLVRSTCRI